MLAAKPLILLIKIPVPEASEVIELFIVGPLAVLQQTPRAVTAAPPSEVIFPPEEAVVVVIADAAAVVIVGANNGVDVVNEISLP